MPLVVAIAHKVIVHLHESRHAQTVNDDGGQGGGALLSIGIKLTQVWLVVGVVVKISIKTQIQVVPLTGGGLCRWQGDMVVSAGV